MNHLSLACVLLLAAAGCSAPDVLPPASAVLVVARWAAPHEPVDVTVITPVESAGASATD